MERSKKINISKNRALAQYDEDMSSIDFVKFIRRNFRILLSSILMGIFLGIIVAFVVPEKWEATALVRVGQIGDVDSRIETPLALVDRMKSTSFQNDVLKRLGMPVLVYDANSSDFRETFKVKLGKSELINLTLRGASHDGVMLQMIEVINELKTIHNGISAPALNRLHQELAMIDLELKRSNEEVELLKKLIHGSLSQDTGIFSQSVLVSSVLLASEGELRACRDRKRIIEAQLSSERTFPTDVLGKVEVYSTPVFPKKSLFAVVGLLIGLLFGVVFSILKSIDYSKGSNQER